MIIGRRSTLSMLMIAAMLLLGAGSAHCAEQVVMSVQQPYLNNFLKLVDENNGKAWDISSLPPGNNHRIVAEMVIIARALHLGGMDATLKFLSVPNSRRETYEVAQGNAVICSQQFNKGTFTTEEYENAAYMSSPITRFGEFRKGFYCLEDNTDLLKAKTLSDIRKTGPGIIGTHWKNDAEVLGAMGITNIVRAPTFKCMVMMLKAGRAQWIPLAFSGEEDLSHTHFGVRLVPVPGLSFSLLESRHFMVSKNHPNGKKVFSALESGLKQLRDEGFIRKILTQACFFNKRTTRWKLLNEDALKVGKTPAPQRQLAQMRRRE